MTAPRLAAIVGPTLAISIPWPTCVRNCRRLVVIMVMLPKGRVFESISANKCLTVGRYTGFVPGGVKRRRLATSTRSDSPDKRRQNDGHEAQRHP